MANTVHCVFLDKEGERLDMPPWPGELGKKVQESICKEAWAEWMRYQTMLINEKRLSPMDKEHRKYLGEQMEKFLFKTGDVDPVSGYTPRNG